MSNSDGGFTLLEVLVALVIAGLALAALFSGALAGLRSTQVSAHYQEALSRANSHLAEIGRNGALVAGEQSGDDGGGFAWRVRIAPITSAPASFGDVDPVRAPRAVLYDVAVVISWRMDGAARSVALEGHRVGLGARETP